MHEIREWQLWVPDEDMSCIVECSRVGSMFRMQSIPLFFGDLVSYGDLFEADERGDELILRRVVQRAGRRSHDFLLSERSCRSKQLTNLLSKVEGLGGYWEKVFGGILLISMPAESTFDPTHDVHVLDRDPTAQQDVEEGDVQDRKGYQGEGRRVTISKFRRNKSLIQDGAPRGSLSMLKSRMYRILGKFREWTRLLGLKAGLRRVLC